MNKKTMIIIIILVVIMLALATFLAINFLLTDKNENEVVVKEKYYHNVGEIISNLKDSKRLVKCNITVEVTDEGLLDRLEKENFLINHEINEIIRNKVEKDLEGKEGQQNLQNEITKKLVEIFDNNEIINIYFNELIVQ